VIVIRRATAAENEVAQRFYARTGMAWSETERLFKVDGARVLALVGDAAP